jgi:hypothetical protein
VITAAESGTPLPPGAELVGEVVPPSERGEDGRTDAARRRAPARPE